MVRFSFQSDEVQLKMVSFRCQIVVNFKKGEFQKSGEFKKWWIQKSGELKKSGDYKKMVSINFLKNLCHHIIQISSNNQPFTLSMTNQHCNQPKVISQRSFNSHYIFGYHLYLCFLLWLLLSLDIDPLPLSRPFNQLYWRRQCKEEIYKFIKRRLENN